MIRFARENFLKVTFLFVFGQQFPKPKQGNDFQGAIASFSNFDGTNLLSKIKNPTLVAHGSEDNIFNQKSGQNIANAINNANRKRKIAKFEILQDDGHASLQGDPEEFLEDWEQWEIVLFFVNKSQISKNVGGQKQSKFPLF